LADWRRPARARRSRHLPGYYRLSAFAGQASPATVAFTVTIHSLRCCRAPTWRLRGSAVRAKRRDRRRRQGQATCWTWSRRPERRLSRAGPGRQRSDQVRQHPVDAGPGLSHGLPAWRPLPDLSSFPSRLPGGR